MTWSSSTSSSSLSLPEVKPMMVYDEITPIDFIINAFKNRSFTDIEEIFAIDEQLLEIIRRKPESQKPTLLTMLVYNKTNALMTHFPDHPETLKAEIFYLEMLTLSHHPFYCLLAIEAYTLGKLKKHAFIDFSQMEHPLKRSAIIMLGIHFYSLLNINGCLSSFDNRLKTLLDKEQRNYPELKSIDEMSLILQQGFEANEEAAKNDLILAKMITCDIHYEFRPHAAKETNIGILSWIYSCCEKFNPEKFLTDLEMYAIKSIFSKSPSYSEKYLATIHDPIELFNILKEYQTDTLDLAVEQSKAINEESKPLAPSSSSGEIKPLIIYGKEIPIDFIINAFNSMFLHTGKIKHVEAQLKEIIHSQSKPFHEILESILSYSVTNTVLIQFPNHHGIEEIKKSYIEALFRKHQNPILHLFLVESCMLKEKYTGNSLEKLSALEQSFGKLSIITQGINLYSLLNINGSLSSFLSHLKDLLDNEQRNYPDLISIDETTSILQQGLEANRKAAENNIDLARLITYDIFFQIRKNYKDYARATLDWICSCCERFGANNFLTKFEIFIAQRILDVTGNYPDSLKDSTKTPTTIYFLLKGAQVKKIKSETTQATLPQNSTTSSSHEVKSSKSPVLHQESKRPAEDKTPINPPPAGDDIVQELKDCKRPNQVSAAVLENISKKLSDINIITLKKISDHLKRLHHLNRPIGLAVQQRIKELTPSLSKPLKLEIVAQQSASSIAPPIKEADENKSVKQPKKKKENQAPKWLGTRRQRALDTTTTSKRKDKTSSQSKNNNASSSSTQDYDSAVNVPNETKASTNTTPVNTPNETKASTNSTPANTPNEIISHAIKVLENANKAFNKLDRKLSPDHEVQKIRDAMFGALSNIANQCQEMWRSKHGIHSCIFLSEDNATNLRNWFRHDVDGYAPATWEHCQHVKQACELIVLHLKERQRTVANQPHSSDKNSPNILSRKSPLLNLMLEGIKTRHSSLSARKEKELIQTMNEHANTDDDDISKMAAGYRYIRKGTCDKVLGLLSDDRLFSNNLAHSQTLKELQTKKRGLKARGLNATS